MAELRQDWFIDQDIRLLQDPAQFCFNTDTVLLARFMEIRPGDRVIDIGTNNGVLLVYAAQFHPRSLTGIEVLPAAAGLARRNLAEMENASVICGRVQDISDLRGSVIISNPPFFTQTSTCRDTPLTPRQMGRVEFNLTLQELCQAASRMLEDKGRFYFVHRPDRIQEIMTALAANGLGVRKLQVVYDHRTGQARSLLVCAARNGGGFCEMLPPGEI